LNINIFPKVNPQLSVPGVLGLYIEYNNTAFVIGGSLPIIKHLQESELDGVKLILPSVSPMNLGGVPELAHYLLQDDAPAVRVFSPAPLQGWIKALIQENDYQETSLNELNISGYKIDQQKHIINEPGVRIEYIPELTGWSDSLFRVSFDLPLHDVFYCDVMDLTKSPPKCLKGAQSVIVNLSNYPALMPPDQDIDFIINHITYSLADFGVKTIYFPTEDGLLETNLAEEESESYPYAYYDIGNGKLPLHIVHDSKVKHYRESMLPVSISADCSEETILLGMDLGTVLHQRAKSSFPLNFSTIITLGSSYSKVFTCMDLLEQIKTLPLDIICGESMSSAIQYFKQLYQETYHRTATYSSAIKPSLENDITQHLTKNESLEILMIPYPDKSDNYLARITDIENEEYLVYTETLENEEFLISHLPGIQTLVIAIEKNDKAYIEKSNNHIKELQKEHGIERVLILSPLGTGMSSIDV
jgi:hypothetical protein